MPSRLVAQSCHASVRKSLQGLDNYVAEGGRAFDSLISLWTLMKYGAPESTVHEIKEKLKLLKQYLKGDCKVKMNMFIINKNQGGTPFFH